MEICKTKFFTTFKKIFITYIVVILLLANTASSFAAAKYTPENQGQAIAAFAEKAVLSGEFYYRDYDLENGVLGNKNVETGKIHVVCTTFVDYVYRQVIGSEAMADYWYANNLCTALENGTGVFKRVALTDAKPGDVFVTRAGVGHAAVYLGNGTVAQASNSRDNLKISPSGLDWFAQNGYMAGRLKDGTEADVLPGATIGNSSFASSGFEYNGVAGSGRYVGSQSLASVLKWLIDQLGQILDFLMGLMTLGIKMQLVGWTNIVESIIDKTVKSVTASEKEAIMKSPSSVDGEKTAPKPLSTNLTKESDKITIENMVYNNISVLDINLFKSTREVLTESLTSAEKKNVSKNDITEPSVMETIRNNVAIWYYSFRQIAIVGMLIVLIYLGIRMALSTVASDKAKYKQMLLDWVVSFLIIFFIHYFMIFVINLNESFVEIIKGSSGTEASLYDTVKTKAYEMKFTSGMTGAIMYMILVYLSVRFLFIYLKRLLVITLLIVLAPFIGVGYAFEKIKNNKSTILSTWMKDFVFMTFMQTIHALLYTVFVVVALDVAMTSLSGIILAFVMLNFMLKAQDIVTTIFGMEKSSSLRNTLNTSVGSMIRGFGGVQVAKLWYGSMYKMAKAGLKTAPKVVPTKVRYKMNGAYNNLIDGAFGADNAFKHRKTSKRMSLTERKMEAERAKIRNMRKEMRSRGKGSMIGAAQMMAAMPMLIMKPKAGMALAFRGKANFDKAKRARDNKYGKGKKYTKGDMALSGAKYGSAVALGAAPTVAMYGAGVAATLQLAKSTNDKYMGSKEEREKIYDKINNKLPEKIGMLHEIREIEKDIEKEYEKIKEDINSMTTSEELRKQYDRELLEDMSNVVKEVSKKDIDKSVNKYLNEKAGMNSSNTNIDELVESLKEDSDEADVTYTENIKDNIEEEAKDEYMKNNDIYTEKTEKEVIDMIDRVLEEEIGRGDTDELSRVSKDIITEAFEKSREGSLTNKDVNNILKKIEKAARDREIEVEKETINKKLQDENINKDDIYKGLSEKQLSKIVHKAANKADSIDRGTVREQNRDLMAKLELLHNKNKELKKKHKDYNYNMNRTIRDVRKNYNENR